MARRKLERTIEESNRSWALKRYGNALTQENGRLIVRKMNAYPDRDWPDRMFIGKPLHRKGYVLFMIEYKRAGKEATEQQARFHDVLRFLGVPIEVVDNKDFGIAVIRYYMEGVRR